MIGITLGDPSGIGPEITLKALGRRETQAALVIGSKSALEWTARKLKLRIPAGLRIQTTGSDPLIEFGKVQRSGGEAALVALETGVNLLKTGVIRGLVTAPVSKEALRLAGFEFPGQTEFLATRLGAKHHAMMAYSECGMRNAERGIPVGKPQTLRIVFVTIHKPLAEVPAAITPRAVAEKIALLDEYLRKFERIRKSKIAVLALNPHAREFTLGEEARIARGIRQARPVNAGGPFPADTVGLLLDRYDGIVAMYHDQAMIPAKLLAQGRGVNVTLGLPAIRTSPLHGTAFDIAGKGIASPDSMRAAIELCLRLCK